MNEQTMKAIEKFQRGLDRAVEIMGRNDEHLLSKVAAEVPGAPAIPAWADFEGFGELVYRFRVRHCFGLETKATLCIARRYGQPFAVHVELSTASISGVDPGEACAVFSQHLEVAQRAARAKMVLAEALFELGRMAAAPNVRACKGGVEEIETLRSVQIAEVIRQREELVQWMVNARRTESPPAKALVGSP